VPDRQLLPVQPLYTVTCSDFAFTVALGDGEAEEGSGAAEVSAGSLASGSLEVVSPGVADAESLAAGAAV
jgi:hypothetical protein